MNRFAAWRALFASVLALLITFVVGAVQPALAESNDSGPPPESAPTSTPNGVIQALVVGSTAFALMLATAAAVLYYTAKRRRDEPL